MTSIVAESTRDLESEVTVIRLEQDYGSTQFLKLTRLETQLHTALDASPKVLLLDLSDTTFIGAAFLSVLIRCCTRATRINCRFALCMLQVLPADVVSMLHCGSTWLTFDTRQTAVKALTLPSTDRPLTRRHLNYE
jgi:anti-sigma B factor antagonist